MQRFSKRDLIFSLITGLITGFSAWRIFEFLKVPALLNISLGWLVVIVPILWIIGVNLGYFLGQWLPFFSQFGKFSAIGFTNAAVDFGVLNLLIAFSGISSGWHYSIFKAVSFVCAVIPSYFWNKFWTFRPAAEIELAFWREGTASQRPTVPAAQRTDNTGTGTLEFTKFFGVSLLAILVNNATASFIVNYIRPLLGLSPQVWANIGAIAGSAMALIFSFTGFKLAVFRK